MAPRGNGHFVPDYLRFLHLYDHYRLLNQSFFPLLTDNYNLPNSSDTQDFYHVNNTTAKRKPRRSANFVPCRAIRIPKFGDFFLWNPESYIFVIYTKLLVAFATSGGNDLPFSALGSRTI